MAWDKATNVDTLISHTFSIGSCYLPATQFSTFQQIGYEPLTVNFSDESTAQPTATSWTWDFGDGGTSTAQNPTHIYNSHGLFTVTHTATNSCGTDNEVKTSYIRVKCCRSLRGNVNYDPQDLCTVADLNYLVQYLFNSGPIPYCLEEADINGINSVTVADITTLVNYLYNGGSAPAPCPQ